MSDYIVEVCNNWFGKKKPTELDWINQIGLIFKSKYENWIGELVRNQIDFKESVMNWIDFE